MLAATFLLAACSADEPSAPEPIDSDFEGIVLNISNPRSNSTRAEGENDFGVLEGDEGKISSLTIMAYPQSGTDKTPAVKVVSGTDLTAATVGSKPSDEWYIKVPFRLKEGSYNIYVMANVDKSNLCYDKNSYSSSSSDMETILKGVTEANLGHLNISAEPTADGSAIPMSCHANAVEWKAKGDASNSKGTITIKKKETTTVYATLIFAMAKVNYTVYNGKIPMLKMASDASKVQFLNYDSRVGLLDHINDDDHKKPGIDLEGTVVATPKSVGSNGTFFKCKKADYPDNGGPDEEYYTGLKPKSDSDPGDEIDPSSSDTWVYQGVAYVPERLFIESTPDPTMIKFNFAPAKAGVDVSQYNKAHEFGGEDIIYNPLNPGHDHAENDGSSKHYGVVRGVIYDVLIYTTRKDITLQVRVRPWAYAKYTWTL